MAKEINRMGKVSKTVCKVKMNPNPSGVGFDGDGWRDAWSRLLKRAEMALDEQGREHLARATAVADKLKAKNGIEGEPAGTDGVRKALARYYADVAGDGGMLGFRKVFAECKVDPVDYFDLRELVPELRMVFNYILKFRDEMHKLEADEMGHLALDSQRRLVTEEGCELNQKAVELQLRASLKGVYGNEDKSEKGGKSGVTYNLPGLTINMITAPVGGVGRVGCNAADGEAVIDVSGEVKEISR